MQRKADRKRGVWTNRKVVAGACVVGGIAAFQQASKASLLPSTVFNDTLATSGSTMNSASQSYSNTATPAATSTNYDVAASKDSTGSTYSSGSPLALKMVSTSGGITEVQALFTSTPIQLTTVGQAVELTATFTDGSGLNTNSSSAIYFGLYSSGGKAPYSNLQNGSSTSAPITGIHNSPETVSDDTGGTENWVGYEADSFGGSKPKEYLRPAQTLSTDNSDQALVGAGQTGGPASATATQATYIGQSSASDPLTASDVYTNELIITLTAPGVYTLSEALYSGSSDAGTQIGTTTTGTLSTTLAGGAGFDALAIGYRQSASVASEMDISQVQVTTNAVPEPASLGLIGIAGLGLMRRRRRA